MSEFRPVLLAEDNEEDVQLILKAFEQSHTRHPLRVVHSGDEAIQYLGGEGKYADRADHPLPALFLMDMRMPGTDGVAVLNWLKEHPEISRAVPVIVLSSVELPQETQLACASDIQACIVKPLSFNELRERIRILKEYWLDDAA